MKINQISELFYESINFMDEIDKMKKIMEKDRDRIRNNYRHLSSIYNISSKTG